MIVLNDIIEGLLSIRYKVLIKPWKRVCNVPVWTKMPCRPNHFHSDAAKHSLPYSREYFNLLNNMNEN